jgi:hypothetical protein
MKPAYFQKKTAEKHGHLTEKEAKIDFRVPVRAHTRRLACVWCGLNPI